MRLSALGSGSKGNSTLLSAADANVMIDCGFGIREAEKRLSNIGLSPQQLDAILVTHEHSDHIHGVESLAAKYDIPVYMSAGSYRGWKHKSRVKPNIIRADEAFTIQALQVLPVSVPHDAREPVQFVFSCAGHKVGVLTDLGSLTPHILEAYKSCHTLLVEANHDLQMLREGPYPYSLKQRVAGNWGHLNNSQTADFISRVNECKSLKNLIVGHISEQNNQIELAAQALSSQMDVIENVIFASQDKPLDWINLL